MCKLICWVDVAIVLAIPYVFTSKTASADLVAPLIDNLCTSWIVCGMDVRYKGMSCMSGIAWLTCDIVDIIVTT